MQWRGRRASTQVEDRRGQRGRMPMGRRGAGLGCGGIVLVVLFSMITGQDPLQILQLVGGISSAPSASTNLPPASSGPAGAPQDDAGQFVAVILGDTEEVWTQLWVLIAIVLALEAWSASWRRRFVA